MAEITARQFQAIRDFVDLDPHLWLDIGPQLSCGEADTFAEVFRSWDEPELATEFLAAHAESDIDDEDTHGHLKRT